MPFSESKLADLIATFAEQVSDFRDAMRRRVPYELSEEFYLLCVGLAICKARFGGPAGSSEYKVLTAAWRIAVEAGTTLPTLPLRRLTNEAGIGSRNTTADALSRLSDGGWVEIVERTDGVRGNQYSLRIPDELMEEVGVRKPEPICNHREKRRDRAGLGPDVAGDVLVDSWLIQHDAFAYKALGSTAARLYIHLLAGHRTHRELVALTGMHRDTVKRNLRRLVDHGLVLDNDAHWEAVPFSAARLDFIARKYSTIGRHEAQARRHEQERQDNIMRQLVVVIGDKDVDRRDYAMVDGGTLVNLHTGELPDVYGQFWWLDRLRLGRVAATAAAFRRAGRNAGGPCPQTHCVRSEVTLRLTSATERPRPRPFRAVVATPALQGLAKRAGEVWNEGGAAAAKGLRRFGSMRLYSPRNRAVSGRG